MSLPLSLTLVVLLVMCAWRDIATRTIPNFIGLMLATVGVIIRTLQGPSALVLSTVITFGLFVVLLVIYARGFIGGGDVKLIAAVAVGLSPLDSYRFLVTTAIAGGFLGIIYLLLARLSVSRPVNKRTSLLGRVLEVEAWRIRRRRSLPYGVAITAGGALTLLHSWSF